MDIVTYFTKHGDRKRYFTTAKKKTFFLSKLQVNLKKVETEKHIITLVMGYHKEHSPKKYEEGQIRTQVYLDYVNETEKILKKSVKKLESILNE